VELKLAFLGTPEFAVPSLRALAAAGHRILAVYTQPDRPKGRGNQLAASPVKVAALEMGLPVHQPARVRQPEVVQFLRGLQLDAMVVVGYGQIIPQSILDLAPLGIINVHASLLPAYRGAAPVQWAIANGESVTGVTTMIIDAGLDTGDILLRWETPVGKDETAPQLSARLAIAGAHLLIQTISGLAGGSIHPQPQDNALATRAPILKRVDGRIDWAWPAYKIYCRMRGFDPWPGAWTSFRGQTLHIRAARPTPDSIEAAPGTLVPAGNRLLVACGGPTTLELIEVQAEGRKRITAAEFRAGQRLLDNERLGESV
jgi:methionyl-tRNA formyltransferase